MCVSCFSVFCIILCVHIYTCAYLYYILHTSYFIFYTVHWRIVCILYLTYSSFYIYVYVHYMLHCILYVRCHILTLHNSYSVTVIPYYKLHFECCRLHGLYDTVCATSRPYSVRSVGRALCPKGASRNTGLNQ